MATQRHAWIGRADSRQHRRNQALRNYALSQARVEFDQNYPHAQFGPVVALVAAYNEEENIGAVLKAMPIAR